MRRTWLGLGLGLGLGVGLGLGLGLGVSSALVEGALADTDAEHAARALLRGELLPLALRVVERTRLLVTGLEDRDAWADGGDTVEG